MDAGRQAALANLAGRNLAEEDEVVPPSNDDHEMTEARVQLGQQSNLVDLPGYVKSAWLEAMNQPENLPPQLRTWGVTLADEENGTIHYKADLLTLQEVFDALQISDLSFYPSFGAAVQQ